MPRAIGATVCLVLLSGGVSCFGSPSFQDLPGVSEAQSGNLAAEDFFRAPAYGRPKLSPSGGQLAAIRRLGDDVGLVRLDLGSGVVRPITVVTKFEIVDFWWVSDERILVSTCDASGLEHRLSAVNLDGSGQTNLCEQTNSAGTFVVGPDSQFEDDVIDLLPDDPAHVLVAYPGVRTSGLIEDAAVYRQNVFTGRLNAVAATSYDPQIWLPGRDGSVSWAFVFNGSESFFIRRDATLRRWSPISVRSAASLSESDVLPLGVADESGWMYVRSRHAGDRWALYRYLPEADAWSEPLFEHPEFDVEGPLIYSSPAPGQPKRAIGVHYTADYPRIHWLDARWRDYARTLDQALPETINSIVSWSRDEERLLVLASSDRDPGTYYLFEPRARSLVRLFSRYPDLPSEDMVAVSRVSFHALDGTEISGYLALPRNRRDERVPVLINPHGGPLRARPPGYLDTMRPFRGRDSRAFDPELQFFVSRGWAVFRPNYRGSTGYGRRFERLGYKQWGVGKQNDLTAAARWLIQEGIADSDRICAYGVDYGGYASVASLRAAPDLFRCAASRDGVFDLVEYLRFRGTTSTRLDFTPLPGPMLPDDTLGELALTLGRLPEDREVLRAASLIDAASDLTGPVFLAYGDRGSLIPGSQSIAMAQRLRARGSAWTTYLMPLRGQATHLWHESVRIRFYENLAAFLSQSLDASEAGARADRADVD